MVDSRKSTEKSLRFRKLEKKMKLEKKRISFSKIESTKSKKL